ncbi:type II toxin-antitoxin system HicB family antitoxin [Companilactobacillus hulinensis]|uniref:type II toxin-antitoxin system HicB family antitoxin n=1 Tax=Companilactobacillus hulinensis TaxID=2486007 RepID=UPI000F796EBA|nr:type II toxin-antitoxin system HicB family antitoxin [Companilactobacillus hulinensis]
MKRYPVVITEYNDEGRYFVVTSPAIHGMVTQGDSLDDAKFHAKDAIETMIEDVDKDEVLNYNNWKLKENDTVAFITID